MGIMTEKPHRHIRALTKAEAKALATLNGYLAEAETWILSRSKRGLATYYKICEADAYMDVSLDAQVHCFRGRAHPADDSSRGNLVMVIEAGFLLSPDTLDIHRTVWRALHANTPDPLSGLRTCRLFEALYCQHHAENFAQMLEIGALQVEIAMRQERELAWTPA